MAEEEHRSPPVRAESEREKMLREKIGNRTIVLVLVSMVALIELLIIVQLSVK
jgi:hypothetical protein